MSLEHLFHSDGAKKVKIEIPKPNHTHNATDFLQKDPGI